MQGVPVGIFAVDQLNPAVERRDRAGFDAEILPLAIDQQRTFGDAHHAFGAFDRGQSHPLHKADGVELGVAVKNPAAAGEALPLVQRSPPAGVLRQPQRRQPLRFRLTMMMLRVR